QQFIASFNTASGNRLMIGHQSLSDTLNVYDNGWQDSGVVVFDDAWHHIAFVLNSEADELQVYVDGDPVFSFATETVIQADDRFSLGHEYDGATPSDFYDGLLDDVQVYNYALTLAEISGLVQGGGAENPVPNDGCVGFEGIQFSWIGGAAVTGYEVYLGSSKSEVANATKSSPEYKGATQESNSSNIFDTIKFFSQYFWRVDTVTATGTVAGKVWSFSTGDYKGVITRQVWTGISGNYISYLTGDSDYPERPDFCEEISSFEGPTNWDEKYGTRIHGFLVPGVSGSYTFWISGDDYSELWLSSDEFPSHVSKICEVPGWSSSRQWDKFTQQRSVTVGLVAGKHYYIKALHKEGGGGDNIAVAWQGPGMSQQVIDGSYLMPYFAGYIWTPQFNSDPIVKSDAIEGYGYSGSLAGEAEPTVGTTVTYSRSTGGIWLDVAADGTLSGVPGDMDTGVNHFTIRATDEV
ncbi:MAG: hypothetical protein KAS23_06235, partial [Anaerohalosphaera sp.]|nr:hypothetical protein [Anaerohalosphaera sp.]